MLTFNLPVVNRNCFLLSIIVWCMGYYLLAWILFVMVAAVEYDEVKSLYSTYEEFYTDRMEQERGKNTEDISGDSHILEEQIRLYTEENQGVAEITADIHNSVENKGENSYNYHETENADLENDSSGPRTQYTEIEAFWTEMIYKDWYHPTGIVMPEAIHYDVHSICMYHSYYTYKKMEAELNLLTNNITLPTKNIAIKANEVSCSASIGLGGTPSKKLHPSKLTVYGVDYTHEVAYKRGGVPLVQGAKEYKYVWV